MLDPSSPSREHGPAPRSEFGIASLVVGGLSILLCWIPIIGLMAMPLYWLGALLGVAGLIVGLTSRNQNGATYALVGLFLSGSAWYVGSIQQRVARGAVNLAVGALESTANTLGAAGDAVQSVLDSGEAAKKQTSTNVDAAKLETPSETKPPIRSWEPSKLNALRRYTAYYIIGEYKTDEFWTTNDRNVKFNVPLSADKMFKDKDIIVIGTVKDTGSVALTGEKFVILKGHENRYPLFKNIQCLFDKENETELAALKSGQKIYIAGTCDGLFGNVLLKHCKYLGPSSSFPSPQREGMTGLEIQEEARKQDESRKAAEAAYKLKQQREAELQKQTLERAAREAREREEAQYHTWTSANGSFTTKAKILSYANGTITIETREHKKIEVPLEKLSEADREYVAKWRQERSKERSQQKQQKR